MSHLHDVTASKPNPVFGIEQRPDNFTGHAWYAVLTYKEHSFEERLPFDFAEHDEIDQEILMADVGRRLTAKIRPILLAEDAEPSQPPSAPIITEEHPPAAPSLIILPGSK